MDRSNIGKQFIRCFCILLLIKIVISSAVGLEKLEEVFSWKQLGYNINGKSFNENDDSFIPYNNVPMGIDRWHDKLFITIPRRRHGIPATLNYVQLKENGTYDKSPDLTPYPDLSSNSLDGNNPLVNVYRTRVDACDRIWMMDTGVLEYPDGFIIVQEVSVVIFDLHTDKLIQRYELKELDYKCSDHSGFAAIVVDVDANDCGNAYAYIPDLYNYAMVVYSLKENRSWKVNHNYFALEPEHGDFNIGGQKFQWSDGIFSVALGPVDENGFRNAYFHALTSNKERSISTRILKNETLATRSYHENDFKSLGDRGDDGQCTSHSLHQETGIMVFAQVQRNALTCWNMSKPLSGENIGIIAQDDVEFIYPSDMKIENDNIWVITNKLPIFSYSKLDIHEFNYRIFRTTINIAIDGTVCGTSSA